LAHDIVKRFRRSLKRAACLRRAFVVAITTVSEIASLLSKLADQFVLKGFVGSDRICVRIVCRILPRSKILIHRNLPDPVNTSERFFALRNQSVCVH
jgi:hypothetical protein